MLCPWRKIRLASRHQRRIISLHFGRERSSVGRASPCQGERRGFKSLRSLHFLFVPGDFSGFFSLHRQEFLSDENSFPPPNNFSNHSTSLWKGTKTHYFPGNHPDVRNRYQIPGISRTRPWPDC